MYNINDGIEDGVLHEYRGDENCVTIPFGVRVIGESAFSGCRKLRTVTVPESVVKIRENAFGDCIELEAVNIPKGLTVLSAMIFDGCISLKEIDIPESVREIGEYAFSGCLNLLKAVIPEGTERIGAEAFCNCKSMTSVSVPDSAEFVDNSAFIGCDRLQRVFCSPKTAERFQAIPIACALRGAVRLLKQGSDSVDLRGKWIAHIRENAVRSFEIMKDDAEFYGAALADRCLPLSLADTVIEFTEDLECRAMLLEYKRNAEAQ